MCKSGVSPTIKFRCAARGESLNRSNSTCVTARTLHWDHEDSRLQEAPPILANTVSSPFFCAFPDIGGCPIFDCAHVLAKYNPDSLSTVLTTKRMLH
jgi:hypothetical protein